MLRYATLRYATLRYATLRYAMPRCAMPGAAQPVRQPRAALPGRVEQGRAPAPRAPRARPPLGDRAGTASHRIEYVSPGSALMLCYAMAQDGVSLLHAEPMPMEERTHNGFCNATELRGGDCGRGDERGAWSLPTLEECAARCEACDTCRCGARACSRILHSHHSLLILHPRAAGSSPSRSGARSARGSATATCRTYTGRRTAGTSSRRSRCAGRASSSCAQAASVWTYFFALHTDNSPTKNHQG